MYCRYTCTTYYVRLNTRRSKEYSNKNGRAQLIHVDSEHTGNKTIMLSKKLNS